MQASDNMTEALVSLVNLSTLAWRLLERDTSVHGTKGRLERARSTALLGQDRRASALQAPQVLGLQADREESRACQS